MDSESLRYDQTQHNNEILKMKLRYTKIPLSFHPLLVLYTMRVAWNGKQSILHLYKRRKSAFNPKTFNII